MTTATSETKACADCKRSKPLDEFHRKRDKFGQFTKRESYCKLCIYDRVRFSREMRRALR